MRHWCEFTWSSEHVLLAPAICPLSWKVGYVLVCWPHRTSLRSLCALSSFLARSLHVSRSLCLGRPFLGGSHDVLIWVSSSVSPSPFSERRALIPQTEVPSSIPPRLFPCFVCSIALSHLICSSFFVTYLCPVGCKLHEDRNHSVLFTMLSP